MSAMNILVIGSEGAIGSRLVNMLTITIPTATIIRVGKSTSSFASETSMQRLLIGDLLDRNFVDAIFKKYDIQVVIFCAAKWNGINQDPTVLDVNVRMFSNVLAALRDTVTNFIYLSSSAVYAPGQCNDSLSIKSLPDSTYGKSKLINEILLLNKSDITGLEVTIYRPFHVVSPHEKYCLGRSHITTDFVHRYIELETDFIWKSLPNDVFIPFYWVDDLCEIIAKNIFNLDFVGKVFNVGASYSFSILNLAVCIATVATKYGLSAHQLPVIENDLTSVENNMVSKLSEMIVTPEPKDLMEIVERFITEKYGIAYEY